MSSLESHSLWLILHTCLDFESSLYQTADLFSKSDAEIFRQLGKYSSERRRGGEICPLPVF